MNNSYLCRTEEYSRWCQKNKAITLGQLFDFLRMGNIKINSINYFLLLRVWCHNSSTIVPKSWVSKPLSALHIKGCAYLCYCLLSSGLRNIRDMS